LEQSVRDLLCGLALTIPDDWQNKIAARIENELRIQLDTDTNAQIERQKKTIERQLKRHRNLYVYGDIEEDEYLTQRNKWRAELTKLDALLKPEVQGVTVDDVAEIAALVQDIPTLLEQATPKELRDLYPLLFEQLIVEGGEITIAVATTCLWQLASCGIMDTTVCETCTHYPTGTRPLSKSSGVTIPNWPGAIVEPRVWTTGDGRTVNTDIHYRCQPGLE
jgi:hypothetical protein